MDFGHHAHLTATELRLGLPGATDKPSKPSTVKGKKRAFLEMANELRSEKLETGSSNVKDPGATAPRAK